MTLSLSVSSRTLIKDLLCRYTVPGTADLKVSIQKIYKGNTPAFYNYFIGLLLFWLLCFSCLWELAQFEHFVKGQHCLQRKPVQEVIQHPLLAAVPAVATYHQVIQIIPNHTNLCQTMPNHEKTKDKTNFASVALLPSRSGWTRSRRLKRHVVMWCSPLQILLSSHLYRSKTQSW